MRTAKAIYAEIAIVMESDHQLVSFKSRPRRESLIEVKREASGVPDQRLRAWGPYRWAMGTHWLATFGPKLESRAETREVVNY